MSAFSPPEPLPASTAAEAGVYRRHRPEATALYEVVRPAGLEALLAQHLEADRRR